MPDVQEGALIEICPHEAQQTCVNIIFVIEMYVRHKGMCKGTAKSSWKNGLKDKFTLVQKILKSMYVFVFHSAHSP